MYWRYASQGELPECLAVAPLHSGDELVGRDCALSAWKALLRRRCFNSCVVETGLPNGERLAAFGASVFVTPAFATSELANPRPGLNSRFIASLFGSEPAVRDEASLSGARASDGLDLLVLMCDYRHDLLDAQHIQEAEMLLAYSFAETHTGYRLNRIFIELIGATQRRYHESSGVWRVVHTHSGGERALAQMTREEAFAASGSVAAALFQYHEPRLALRDTEKELLCEALQGASDEEVAARVNVSLPSIKKRWISLFNRVADACPELLPEPRNRREKESRGPEKRRRILAYVRMHPQELRPFRWRATA